MWPACCAAGPVGASYGTFLIFMTMGCFDLYHDLMLEDSVGGVGLVLAGSGEGGGSAVTGE